MLLWPLPLLGLLHAESSAVVAFAAFFVAGISTFSLLERGHSLPAVAAWQIGALFIPLVLLTLTLFWRPNCAYPEGLLFYVLFPFPTVLFSVGLVFALHQWNVKRKRIWLVGLGLIVSAAGPIYDIGFHPQFYTYNHVFGGVLGPIYDEELAIRSGLFVFRGLTIVLAAVFALIGRLGRQNGGRRGTKIAVGLGLCTISAAYVFSAALGFNTTMETIKEALPGHIRTEHFDIYFDPSLISDVERRVLADEHEFRYGRLAATLDVQVDQRIQSFIYPDPKTKADLTGARYTNVAPVWLRVPQSHVMAGEFAHVFPHELAHVFSREFGLPVLNASLSVGLVEGLAVALEPPDGLPTPHEQVSAALLSPSSGEEDLGFRTRSGARDLAAVVASQLSPSGFWTGRGAVSYTTMGSFVRYLLDAYGVVAFKRVYAKGNFAAVYGKSVEELAGEWTDDILSLGAVSASSGPFVAARFAVPSLFEKRCPHYVPPYRAAYRRAATALVQGDSAAALDATRHAIKREPRYLPAVDLWARLSLARGDVEAVRDRLESMADETFTTALYVRLADARALSGDSTGARMAYDRALDRLPSFSHEEAALVYVRILAASHPALVRLLIGARANPQDGDDAVAAIANAFSLARVEAYEQAAELLRTMPAIDTTAVTRLLIGRTAAEALRRRRLVWLARFLYRAGAHSRAATYAETAAGAYRRAGAFNEAAQLDDYREMILRSASSPFSEASSGTNAGTVRK